LDTGGDLIGKYEYLLTLGNEWIIRTQSKLPFSISTTLLVNNPS
jgi:hypothetical protein